MPFKGQAEKFFSHEVEIFGGLKPFKWFLLLIWLFQVLLRPFQSSKFLKAKSKAKKAMKRLFKGQFMLNVTIGITSINHGAIALSLLLFLVLMTFKGHLRAIRKKDYSTPQVYETNLLLFRRFLPFQLLKKLNQRGMTDGSESVLTRVFVTLLNNVISNGANG